MTHIAARMRAWGQGWPSRMAIGRLGGAGVGPPAPAGGGVAGVWLGAGGRLGVARGGPWAVQATGRRMDGP